MINAPLTHTQVGVFSDKRPVKRFNGRPSSLIGSLVTESKGLFFILECICVSNIISR